MGNIVTTPGEKVRAKYRRIVKKANRKARKSQEPQCPRRVRRFAELGQTALIALRLKSRNMPASRRFPPSWKADKMPGGRVVRDAHGQ
jgi:hypothetical protein